MFGRYVRRLRAWTIMAPQVFVVVTHYQPHGIGAGHGRAVKDHVRAYGVGIVNGRVASVLIGIGGVTVYRKIEVPKIVSGRGLVYIVNIRRAISVEVDILVHIGRIWVRDAWVGHGLVVAEEKFVPKCIVSKSE